MQLYLFFSRYAAALQGILDAAWRTLHGFWRGGRRTVLGFQSRAAEQVIRAERQ